SRCYVYHPFEGIQRIPFNAQNHLAARYYIPEFTLKKAVSESNQRSKKTFLFVCVGLRSLNYWMDPNFFYWKNHFGESFQKFILKNGCPNIHNGLLQKSFLKSKTFRSHKTAHLALYMG